MEQGLADISSTFRQDADGTWRCVAPVTLAHPKGPLSVAPGTTFRKGTNFMGVDVAEWLDRMVRACGPGEDS